MDDVAAKTLCRNFEEQLEIAEKIYGTNMKFYFSKKDIEMLLNEDKYYTMDEKMRVQEILAEQMRKYKYLF